MSQEVVKVSVGPAHIYVTGVTFSQTFCLSLVKSIRCDSGNMHLHTDGVKASFRTDDLRADVVVQPSDFYPRQQPQSECEKVLEDFTRYLWDREDGMCA